MIHPNTQLRYINDIKGYGVFATAFLPKGTITYVVDPLELYVRPAEFAGFPEVLQKAVDKYSYIDAEGSKIVSWDMAKFVNHCCNCNTISCGYGFEFAIRDIQEGEEITDEYGLFNIEFEMELACDSPNCRKMLKRNDFDTYEQVWDEKIKAAISTIFDVEQPLYPLLNQTIQDQLVQLKSNPESYRSVTELKFVK